uniref:Uncharacterized protein n=2 Tax=Helianthus annuus TaxID=4232 RepID=A0A251VTS6_HELAN
MWYVELTLGASKVQPVAMGGLCGGTHPGLVRMLPNGLLDPCAVLFRPGTRITASMFTNARCMGEEKVD